MCLGLSARGRPNPRAEGRRSVWSIASRGSGVGVILAVHRIQIEGGSPDVCLGHILAPPYEGGHCGVSFQFL